MAEENWFTKNAPKQTGGDWFAQNAPAVAATPAKEIAPPDAVAQSKERLKAIVRPVSPLPLPGENTVPPERQIESSPFREKQFDEIAKGPGKQFQKDMRTGAYSMIGGGVGGGLAEGLVPGAEAAAGGSKLLKFLLPALTRGSGAGAGAGAGTLAAGGTSKEALGTAATVTGAEVGAEGGIGALKKIFGKTGETSQRINKLLGVKAKQVVPGKTPESLEAFSAQPARGAQKYGLDEKTLSKMTPLERNSAVMAAKDKAGTQLDQVLKQASDSGKTVNLQPVVDKTFKEILDPKLAKQAEERLVQILEKNQITKPLTQLTPMEARTVQRSLDDFAKFSGQGEAKSFSDIARQLRKGISAETRKAVPESAQFDQDYTDLINASKATQNQLKQFAHQAPENQLRKWIIRAAGAGAAFEAGKAVQKHFSPPVP